MLAWIIAGALILWLVMKVVARGARKELDRRAPSSQVVRLPSTGDFRQPIVGESNYQRALRSIAGPGEVEHECTAHLVMEPDNRYDRNAVRVDIDGVRVGYLDRDAAVLYRRRLQAQGIGLVTVECGAKVFGGGTGRSLGVWLDLPEID